ncbi:MAG: M48 family metallopeptidase [Steroidobacteraceae bacterium]
MHPFTLLFLALLIAGLGLRLWLLGRQIRAVDAHRQRVPAVFSDAVSPAQHEKAAAYTIELARFSSVHAVFDAGVLLLFTIAGGIATIDSAVAATGLGDLSRGVAVIAIVALALTVLDLPFSVWRTFRIEARFGFNHTTPALYAVDHLKGLTIAALILGPLTALLLWLFGRAGADWWWWGWSVWAAFSMMMSWAWPRLIAPLFNKFHEMPEGDTRAAVIELARRCGFEPRGIMVMDGSRRSAHGNAYFTGLGRSKRIVLFDTLLAALEAGEVEAVLAHELGHYRLRHVAWRIGWSLATSFGGFALLAWLAGQEWFQPALGVAAGGPHTLFLLFVLAAPVFLLPIGPLAAWLSRRHEYAADAFAAQHADPAALSSALVKLHRDNATTLTPDPVYSAFHASHPPAIQRIGRLAAQTSG